MNRKGKSLKISASNSNGTNDFDVALSDQNLWFTAKKINSSFLRKN